MIEKRKKTNGTRFETSLTIKICKEIIYGIDFLHEHNIIHRDLKPGHPQRSRREFRSPKPRRRVK